MGETSDGFGARRGVVDGRLETVDTLMNVDVEAPCMAGMRLNGA
jgi:hypothetical protein